MKKGFYIISSLFFRYSLVLFFLLATITGPGAFSQSSLPDNKRAHLVQWVPLRLLYNFHQVKLFYEYQPANSRFSFGIAPSVRIGDNYTGLKKRAVELQPFVNAIIQQGPKSAWYAQLFLKAAYINQYDVQFFTKEYYHEPTYFFFFYFPGGTFPDDTYKTQTFFALGGGFLIGYRKFFGEHWFIDINAGLQYIGHEKWVYPEQQSEVAGPFIKASGFNTFGEPGSFFTSHLGFGYRFIKK